MILAKIEWATVAVGTVMFSLGLWVLVSSRYIVKEWDRSSDDLISVIKPYVVTFCIAGLGLIFMAGGLIGIVAGLFDGSMAPKR